MQTNDFNADISEARRNEKSTQLNVHGDANTNFQLFHPEQNSGPFRRRQGIDQGDDDPGPLSNNPLNCPLSDYPNPTWNTTTGYNSINLNPLTFGGNIGASIPNPGRGIISQLTNLQENLPARHLVMSNRASVVGALNRARIPRLKPSTLGKGRGC
jgi:hypothetical protein